MIPSRFFTEGGGIILEGIIVFSKR